MLSRENRVIMFCLFILIPASFSPLWFLDQWFGLPQWTSGAVLLVLGVLVPQIYLGYIEEYGEE